ncbi:hypothetical protein T439DRAFT_360874 [Meredithblackwellia eburnea MCA 4105]
MSYPIASSSSQQRHQQQYQGNQQQHQHQNQLYNSYDQQAHQQHSSSSQISSSPSSIAPPSPPGSFYVQALYAYSGVDTSSLSFRQGDVIEVLSTLASGWWDGVLCDQKVRGWFPSNYVQRISDDEAAWAREQMMGFWEDNTEDPVRRGSTASNLSQSHAQVIQHDHHHGVAGSSTTAGRGDGARFVGGVVDDFGGGGGIRGGAGLAREQTLEDLMAENLTSFSSGADIFGEIAAAAQHGHYGDEMDGRDDIADTGRRAIRMSLSSIAPEGSLSGGEGDEDFWVPKVTQGGQLFYYNTRTSETSRDMPIDGMGDGVHIALDEFPTDVGLDDSPTEQRRRTAMGLTNGQFPSASSSSHDSASGSSLNFPLRQHDRLSTGGSSLLTAWTERPSDGDRSSLGKADTLRRMSTYSDDSVLDTAFSSNRARESQQNQPPELDFTGGSTAEHDGEHAHSAARAMEKHRKGKGRKAVSAELLEPPPPPLINDLESLVTNALQDLINGAGMGGVRGLGGDDTEFDPQLERDQLARLADSVVVAIRTLLHSSGVLEQVVSSANLSASSSSANEISGAPTKDPTLSAAAQLELRPSTRRVTSTLSKLVLTVRSAWGLLETLDADQVLDTDDTPGDEAELTRREQERERILASWAQVRESRFELETKLRAEVLSGARDVQTHVLAFLAEFERVVGESTQSAGGPPLPRALLRAPKALQGSLRTNAAALLLPGGGFGGNWRGNGFVTLPTPTSSPFIPVDAPGPSSLIYSYPSQPITNEVAAALQQDSLIVLEEAESFRSLVNALATTSPASTSTNEPPATTVQRRRTSSSASLASIASRLSLSISSRTPPTRPTDPHTGSSSPSVEDLLSQATKVLRKLAAFLVKVEEIDVAGSVDFELANEPSSRPSSRRENVTSMSSGGTVTTADSPKESDVESLSDPPTTEYKKSVQEARPLLGELEIRKQALYDISPALLAALQELFMPPAGPGAVGDAVPASGPQPLSTSPLSFFVSATRVEFSPDTILEIIADLNIAVSTLCGAITSLGAIAAIQANAPEGLRHSNTIYRSSLFESFPSPSTSSLADSRANGKNRISMTGSRPAESPSSSRVSLARTDDDSAEVSSHSRDSIDSDFYFSKGAPASSTSSMGLSSKTAKLFNNAGSGWGRPRPTSTSSTGSRDMRINTDLERTNSPVSSPTKKKDLAKILGKDAPRTAAGSTPPAPEAAWLGPNLADQSPAWLEADYGPDEISFSADKQVRGGTLRALIIAATSHEGRVDANYLSAFLMTFRTFCTPHELLRLLSERYLVAPPDDLNDEELKVWKHRKQSPIQARVANMLKTWVREHMDHEEMDKDVLRGIAEFAQRQMGKGSAQTVQITNLVEERLRGNTISKRGNLAPGPIPPSIVPRGFRKIKFLDIDPLEIARQLTLKDCALFSQITVQECLGKAWPKQFGSDAPNISMMIDLSNAITRWVTEMILSESDLKKRANTIKHYITIAERCYELHNFSTLIHIIAGLNSTPIHRLRRTWETVNQKSMASLKHLNSIMRPDKNYKMYREALKGVTPPCVPFLGVYLTDWTFIGDGNPDNLREKPHQINFNKRQKASELILMIKLHQSITYNLAAVPQIRQLIDDQLFPVGTNPATDDQRLYEISLSREPRERDDEKIARLLSESGFL